MGNKFVEFGTVVLYCTGAANKISCLLHVSNSSYLLSVDGKGKRSRAVFVFKIKIFYFWFFRNVFVLYRFSYVGTVKCCTKLGMGQSCAYSNGAHEGIGALSTNRLYVLYVLYDI